ncbi:MAG: M56 family metallopeptidase [Eubacterium sp.]|nr:M56 family metallopeptidase [Eubacterium sp.]
MTALEFCSRLGSFFNLCAIYYVVQLVRCAMVSVAVAAVVFLLRRTLFQNTVFIKGALWSLFLPCLFAGRMKFFYENSVGILLFTWWNGIFMNHVWLCWLYLCGVCISFLLFFQKRRRLKRLSACMEERVVEGTAVRVAQLPVTPFAAGILKPVIVLPQVILQKYSKTEIQTILLHEKLHIRLCHLVFYALWDILRALLWLNPLLIIGTKLFREDLEEICDWATILKSSGSAYVYGQLLLKSMRILQEENDAFERFAAFAGEKGYRSIRRRIVRITRYRRYPKVAAAGMALSVCVCAAGMSAWIGHHSFDRYTKSDSIMVYEYHPQKQDARILAYAPESTLKNNQKDSSNFRQMISFDDSYVYVDGEAFNRFLQKSHADGEIFLVFGGFYKLPGIAGYGYTCCYENEAMERDVRIPYESRMDWTLHLVKLL